jgi:RNA polymerase sigma factor (sigma-70 family)
VPGVTGRARGAFRALFHVGTLTGLSDGELLERYTSRADEAAELAFAALVERHGPRVLRVCRAMLPNRTDAEDAFQATFLVLVRRARSIRRKDSIASWLHGVAIRVAKASQAAAIRRAKLEKSAADQARIETPNDQEIVRVVHEELDNLPERFRAPIVLCDLDGLTHDAAAEQLDWPVGTVKSRLARGRARLRARLERRGMGSGGVLIGVKSANVGLSFSLVDSTVSAATDFAAGGVAAGTLRAAVSELVQGVLKMMILHRWIRGAAILATFGALVAGGAVLAQKRVPPPIMQAERPQISFEIRSLQMGSFDWRGQLNSHLKLVSQDDSTTVWTIDDPKATRALLEYCQAHANTNVLQLPKPTTFEGDTATVDAGEGTTYLSSMDLVKGGDGKSGLQPNTRQVRSGLQVKVSARLAGAGLRLRAEVDETRLLRMVTAVVPTGVNPSDSALSAFEVQIPDVKKTQVAADVLLPADSVLLISTGPVVRSKGLLGLNEKTGENVVMILPRVIVLEDIVEDAARAAKPRAARAN